MSRRDVPRWLMTGPANVGLLAAFGVVAVTLRGRARSLIMIVLSIPFWLWAAPATYWAIRSAFGWATQADGDWIVVAILVAIAGGMTWAGLRLWPKNVRA